MSTPWRTYHGRYGPYPLPLRPAFFLVFVGCSSIVVAGLLYLGAASQDTADLFLGGIFVLVCIASVYSTLRAATGRGN